MAFKIIWSETAGEDLRDIVLFIAMDDPDAAARIAKRIIERIETASQFPLSNRVVPEKNERRIREAILKPYRIIYSVDERRNAIHVLRIWHASRGIPEID